MIYEESILMTLLGPDYLQLISQETGEWSHEDVVKFRFQQQFESRIRFVFQAQEE